MKELLRDKQPFLLQTKKQLLESNGIRCEIKQEYQGKVHFKARMDDWVLYCEEADYDRAYQLLDEIDTTAFDDGEELRDKKGRTAEQAIRARMKLEMNIARVVLYILIILVIAAIIYNSK